jgi:hypothetical protein
VSDAQRLARLEKAALRCLELLDAGRSEEARRELAEAAGVLQPRAVALAGGVTDLELDRAFDCAHPVADEVIDADRVARQAIREVDRELLAPREPFATGTMAELLERQGDVEGARRIRDSLAGRGARSETRPGPSRRPERARVVSTLEAWLANMRRED